MPTQVKASIAYSEKMGTANYGSIGASCGMDIEFSPDELAGLQEEVRKGFEACRKAVKDELARQFADTQAAAAPPTKEAPPAKTPEQVRQEAYLACGSADAMKNILASWAQQFPVVINRAKWEPLIKEAKDYARAKIQSGEWTDFDGLTAHFRNLDAQLETGKQAEIAF